MVTRLTSTFEHWPSRLFPQGGSKRLYMAASGCKNSQFRRWNGFSALEDGWPFRLRTSSPTPASTLRGMSVMTRFVKASKAMWGLYCIVVATVVLLADEAGQVPNGALLHPVLSSPRLERLVLVGDAAQLPPYVASDTVPRTAAFGGALQLVVSTRGASAKLIIQCRTPATFAACMGTRCYGSELHSGTCCETAGTF